MTSLARYLQDKDNLSGVVMVRIVYDGGYWDYSRWKLHEKKVFFFDDDMKIGHILWMDDTVSIIDDTKIVINASINTTQIIALELFYGGATL